jgi:hypothetical protein
MSLKFCLQQYRPTPAIDTTIQKMQRSIRIRHWLLQLPADTKDAEDNCITGLYLPSSWIPPLALPSIEKRLLQLENELRQEVKRRQQSRSSNLDFFQTRALKVLQKLRTSGEKQKRIHEKHVQRSPQHKSIQKTHQGRSSRSHPENQNRDQNHHAQRLWRK